MCVCNDPYGIFGPRAKLGRSATVGILVSAVREFPQPHNAVEAKRFVHLAGYYQRFIEGFGSIMAPMTKLLRKYVPWEWTVAKQTVFEQIKAVLTTKPLLEYPDFQLPFRLVTNASNIGLGACLMQDRGYGWQPVVSVSKVNSQTDANYRITELKCLAVVWAIKLFRPYLYGMRFAITTDHSALKWLMTSTNLTGKLYRWALTLQEFDFVAEYRPGTTNVVADALSRAPMPTAKVLAAVGRRRRNQRRAAGRTLIDAVAEVDVEHTATAAGTERVPRRIGRTEPEQMSSTDQAEDESTRLGGTNETTAPPVEAATPGTSIEAEAARENEMGEDAVERAGSDKTETLGKEDTAAFSAVETVGTTTVREKAPGSAKTAPTRTKAKAATKSSDERMMMMGAAIPTRGDVRKAPKSVDERSTREDATVPRQMQAPTMSRPSERCEHGDEQVGPILGGDGE
ncbi:unnamed protein product [Phytophthora fragariaefolia]|uniref:Unnamed protein product n=1 Tax=Phytophthora fragariaefolia TaxID=1490495 RepID=A0A9W7CV52_9STRA|nr:unnamed protein product [Phytophthora fragariaefolia]